MQWNDQFYMIFDAQSWTAKFTSGRNSGYGTGNCLFHGLRHSLYRYEENWKGVCVCMCVCVWKGSERGNFWQ